MFTGGEDCTARIWDLKMRNLSCQVYSPMDRKETSTFLSLANLPSQRTSDLRLPPPQPAGDGCRGPVRSNSHLELTGQTLLLSDAGDISWLLQNDQSEPIIPDPKASIQHVAIDPKGHHMAAVNNKVLDKVILRNHWTFTNLFQGHCYVWALSSGEPKESSKLVPKNKILAHEGRWALTRNKDKPNIWPMRIKYRWDRRFRYLYNFRYSLCCQFSPDSSLLVTTSADHTAKLWRTSDFTLVAVRSLLSDQWNIHIAQQFNACIDWCIIFQELTCPDQRWVWDAAFTADSQ